MATTMHGAFATLADAKRVKRVLGRKAMIRPFDLRGETRYSVITRNPENARRGRKVTFHGAFAHKADAKRAEKRHRHSYIRPITVQGHRRYAVMTRNAGFFSSVWHGAKAGYHHHRAKKYEAKAKRHRARARLNPRVVGTIPGTVSRIQYRRTGANAGPYYHDFRPGVRQYALNDGSVLLRGPQRIHADDRASGFWQRYGHRRATVKNPRRYASGGSDNTFLLWGLAIFLAWKGGLFASLMPPPTNTGLPSTTVWISATEQGGTGQMVVGTAPPGPMPPWREASQYEIAAGTVGGTS